MTKYHNLDHSFLETLHDSHSYDSGMAELLLTAASSMYRQETTRHILQYIAVKYKHNADMKSVILEAGGCAEVLTPDMMLSLDEALAMHMELMPSLSRDRNLLRLFIPYEGFQTARFQMLADWAAEQGFSTLSETLSSYTHDRTRHWQELWEAASRALPTSTSSTQIAA